METIKVTLQWYGKTIDNIVYVLADNCQAMLTLMKTFLRKPHIGCASHKLNLAVKYYLGMSPKEDSKAWHNRTPEQVERYRLVKVCHDVCVHLRTTLNIATLRDEMDGSFVIPLIDQDTRWLSIMNMVERFVRLYPDLVKLHKFHVFLPNHSDVQALKELLVDLAVFKEVALRLQKDSTNIVLTRVLFDSLTKRYPSELSYYLNSHTVFENALFKVLINDNLSPLEMQAMEPFEVKTDEDIISYESDVLGIQEEIQLYKK
jgi:hypothetical protein